MKIAPALAVVLLFPLCSHAAAPAIPATMLSTNLGAAIARLDVSLATNPGTILAGFGRPITNGPTIGTGCGNSPENPTALLATLGFSGLALGRFGLKRRRRQQPVASAA